MQQFFKALLVSAHQVQGSRNIKEIKTYSLRAEFFLFVTTVLLNSEKLMSLQMFHVDVGAKKNNTKVLNFFFSTKKQARLSVFFLCTYF